MSRRILVVDDNELNLKLAQVLLAGAGFEVRTALDGYAAFETLRDWREGYIAKPIDARTFTALIAGHLPPDGQP